jgi:hypothetical protein
MMSKLEKDVMKDLVENAEQIRDSIISAKDLICSDNQKECYAGFYTLGQIHVLMQMMVSNLKELS